MPLRITPCEIGPASKVICHITHMDGTTDSQEVEVVDASQGVVATPDNIRAGDKFSYQIIWQGEKS